MQQRNYHLKTDGEFIKDTSAFRAAMNYDDDNDSDTRENSGEQREYYQADNDVDELSYVQTRRVTPAHYEEEPGRKTEPNVRLQSPSKHRGESPV